MSISSRANAGSTLRGGTSDFVTKTGVTSGAIAIRCYLTVERMNPLDSCNQEQWRQEPMRVRPREKRSPESGVKKVPPPAPVTGPARDKGKPHYRRFPIGPKWTSAGECARMARYSGCESFP